MTEVAHNFDDSAAYERFMGRWSHAVGTVFLDWVAPPIGARWLDIGCGTGVFTKLVLDACAPTTVLPLTHRPHKSDMPAVNHRHSAQISE